MTETQTHPPVPAPPASITDLPPDQLPPVQGGGPEQVWVDYFGFEEEHVFTFPDGQTKIWFRAMNEGDRANFQRQTNRDVSLERNTGNARIRTDPAGERKALILASCTNWNMHRKNPNNGRFEPVPFSGGKAGSTLDQWLTQANPKLVDALEEAIRKANPWLVGDMSLEDIDREIERLQEMREEKVKLEAEKEAFRS
jgi:hypothetical protein